ncbi:MAG: tRNA uridine-5-carboxymethylaminomethyl(34) synthesis GTPase MnmE, partial [Chlamydiia bacterium]|nr:tRNA uridine-5-carboxymethylaminomethyl(34) synthesis GTPase MnmE [Chlamydiia bacterium]
TWATHTLHYGKIVAADGEVIDTGMLVVMAEGRSYTGEETVEISCHGGSLLTERVLQRIVEAGARLAGPGEFTMRAFLNGKLDLSQAEAVQRLIGAKNQLALNAAEKQLQGHLSKRIGDFQQKLTHIAAILEAWVDFPEEGIAFASMEEIIEQLNGVIAEMQALLETFHDGKMIHEGISLCLIGRPNVGKSSLLNALLKQERAIVTEIPGTTRDLLEAPMRMGKLYLKLIDTAGIRDSEERVEQEGIRRSHQALQEADVVLLLADATEPFCGALLEQVKEKKHLLVWNKTDLPHTLPEIAHPFQIRLSAKTGAGLEELKEAIEKLIWHQGAPEKDEVLLTSERHATALKQAISATNHVKEGLVNGVSAEFVVADLRQSLSHLGQIIGTNIGEDILSDIFSTFCIGK